MRGTWSYLIIHSALGDGTLKIHFSPPSLRYKKHRTIWEGHENLNPESLGLNPMVFCLRNLLSFLHFFLFSNASFGLVPQCCFQIYLGCCLGRNHKLTVSCYLNSHSNVTWRPIMRLMKFLIGISYSLPIPCPTPWIATPAFSWTELQKH